MPNWLPRGAKEVYPSHTSHKSFMRKHNIRMLTRFIPFRAWNCPKLGFRKWTRVMQREQDNRALKAMYFKDLFSQRIYAACDEHRFPYKYLMGILPQMGIELDRKALANLAIWEPRSFAALIEICKAKVASNPLGEASKKIECPPGVISRKML